MSILYCKECTMPIEYCEYSPVVNKCKAWLSLTHPDLLAKYFPSSDETETPQTKPSKLEKQQEKREKLKETAKVIIKTAERGKKKRITFVTGLDLFDFDLKKTAKEFSGKFACGCSVVKDVEGNEELCIQGDVAYDLMELLQAKGIPEEKMEKVEEKKKKK